jgi:outer membrane protein assembly factor BamB
MRYSFLRAFILSVAGFWLLWLFGCGGGSSTPTPAPLSLDIHWAARSRVINAPSSARSVVLTLSQAAPDGSDAIFTINRETAPAEYVQHYTSPTAVSLGTRLFTARFFADADGQGPVVGIAAATVTLRSDGTGVGDVLTEGTVASVAVTEGQSLSVTERKELAYTVRDGTGNLLALSPGSVFWAITSGEDHVRIVNGQFFGAASGTAMVTVTVDGRSSQPTPVSVIYRGLAQTPWPKLYADAANTSRGGGSGATGVEKWRHNIGSDSVGITPVFIGANNTLYYGAHRTGIGSTIAMDSATRAIRWSSNKFSQPALSVDGTLFTIGSSWPVQGLIQALDASSGALKWSFEPGERLMSAVTLGPNGAVYATSSTALFAVDGAAGQQKWRVALQNPSLPAIGMEGTLFVTSDNRLIALDTATGAVVWSVTIPETQMTLPSIAADNLVFVGGLSGTIYAYDGATGTQRWLHNADGSAINQIAVGIGGILYSATERGVYALSEQNGALRWSFASGNSVISVGGDGTVYVAAGNLYAVDGQTGQTKWTFAKTNQPLNRGFRTEPTVDTDGTVYAIEGGVEDVLIAIR